MAEADLYKFTVGGLSGGGSLASIDTDNTPITETAFLADSLKPYSASPIRFGGSSDAAAYVEYIIAFETAPSGPIPNAGTWLLTYPNWNARVLFPDGTTWTPLNDAFTNSNGTARILRIRWLTNSLAKQLEAESAILNYGGTGVFPSYVELQIDTSGDGFGPFESSPKATTRPAALRFPRSNESSKYRRRGRLL